MGDASLFYQLLFIFLNGVLSVIAHSLGHLLYDTCTLIMIIREGTNDPKSKRWPILAEW